MITTDTGEAYENEFHHAIGSSLPAPTDKLDFTDKYNSPGGSPGNESYDYDMQGYVNSGGETKGEGVHYPDTYKKPNHPTFSTESQYHDPAAGLQGGQWEKQEDGSFNFYPGATNLQMHGEKGLQDYFDRVEKGNHLMLPYKVSSNNKEDIFFSHYDPKTKENTESDLIRPWKGTPAELYNNLRATGTSHDDAITSTKKYIRDSQDDLGKIFRPDYPKTDSVEELEDFMRTFKGSSLEAHTKFASMINPENDPFHGKPDAGGAAGPLSRPTPEFVDRAALKYKDQVVTGEKGSAHFDLMDKIPKDAKYLDVDDGFVTNTGRYITRKEALMMGGKRGQIDPETFEKSLQKGSGAISEDFADINRARWEKRINIMEEAQKKTDRWDDLLLPGDKEDILKGLKDYVKDKFK